MLFRFRFASGSRSPGQIVGLGTFDCDEQRDLTDPREVALARAHPDLHEPDPPAAPPPPAPARPRRRK